MSPSKVCDCMVFVHNSDVISVSIYLENRKGGNEQQGQSIYICCNTDDKYS